jgi:hypothetical protein
MQVPDDDTLEFIRDNLRYEPETGHLYYTKELGGRSLTKPAGYPDKDYLRVQLFRNGQRLRFPAHQLAWFLHYDEWVYGSFRIYHSDGDVFNNKLSNLLKLPLPDTIMADDRIEQYIRDNYVIDPEAGTIRYSNPGEYGTQWRDMDANLAENTNFIVEMRGEKFTTTPARVIWWAYYGRWPRPGYRLETLDGDPRNKSVFNFEERPHRPEFYQRQSVPSTKQRLNQGTPTRGR